MELGKVTITPSGPVILTFVTLRNNLKCVLVNSPLADFSMGCKLNPTLPVDVSH